MAARRPGRCWEVSFPGLAGRVFGPVTVIGQGEGKDVIFVFHVKEKGSVWTKVERLKVGRVQPLSVV